MWRANGSDETVEEPEVGIIGLGHMGKMMQRMFPGALIYDKHRPGGSATREEVARCRFAFVCVPTEAGPGGNADLSAIQWFNSCLRQAGGAPTGIRVTRPGEGTSGPAGDLPALAAGAQLPAGRHFRSGGHA